VGIVKTFSQSVKIPLSLDNKDVVIDFLADHLASMERRWDEEKKRMKEEIYNLKEELNAKFATKNLIDGMDAKFTTKFDGIYAKFENMEQVLGLQALE
jgi:predicted  nucleic acid-binding Zn-ribbon protein